MSELKQVQWVDQRMRLECGVGFRQLRSAVARVRGSYVPLPDSCIAIDCSRGRPNRERDDVVGGIEERLRTLSPSPISTTWGAAGSVSVSTVDAWFCPEARPQMTDQR